MKKRLFWDLFWLFVFSLSVGFLVFVGSCEAYAEKPQDLNRYLQDAMESWVPLHSQPEGEEEARDRYASIADDVVSVLSDPNEKPLYEHDEDMHRTGLLLMSIASLESSYFARVDEGHCLPRECDSGAATGLWQVHFERGIALDGDGWKYDPSGVHPKDAIANRRLYIRIVMHLLRGPHDGRWDGTKRRRRAEEYAVAHPFQN